MLKRFPNHFVVRYIYNHEKCGECGSAIRTWDMAGRTVYACEECQPLSQGVELSPSRSQVGFRDDPCVFDSSGHVMACKPLCDLMPLAGPCCCIPHQVVQEPLCARGQRDPKCCEADGEGAQRMSGSFVPPRRWQEGRTLPRGRLDLPSRLDMMHPWAFPQSHWSLRSTCKFATSVFVGISVYSGGLGSSLGASGESQRKASQGLCKLPSK